MPNQEWKRKYAERLAKERQQAQAAITSVLPSLLELGAQEVRITYDGYADSGAVEQVLAAGAAGDLEIPDEVQDVLREAVEQLLPGGWEIDQGTYGAFVLNLQTRKLTREHNWRVESSEYEEEILDL